MASMLKKIDELNTKKLNIGLIFLSMLIAAQIQYIQHGWINPDSVLYLESAKLIAAGHWQDAIKIFNWPLYSGLIALTHQLTNLTIHHSAQLLNVIFFGITTASFIKIIDLAAGNNRTIIAGALILFSSPYLTGDVLPMLLRDEGFWACFLTSLVFFIRFYKSNSYADAFFWQIFAILATLFRIEAITYLIVLPLSIFFFQQVTFTQKITQYLKSNFLSIIAIIGISVAILVDDQLSMKSFGRLNEVFTVNLFHQLTNLFFTKSAIMSSEVLGRYLDEFAVPGLFLTFVYVIIVKAISATGMVNIGLAICAAKSKKHLLNNQVFYILSFVALIAVLNMSLIIVKVFVLSSRYVLALSFVLMIFAAFYLAVLLQYIENKNKPYTKHRWLAIGLMAFMLIGLIKNILPKQTGYNYIQNAITWIDEHNLSKQNIFFDDKRMRYYADLPFVQDIGDDWLAVTKAIDDKSINQYQYLLLSFSEKNKDREKLVAEKLPEYQEIQRFNAVKAKKSVVLYQKRISTVWLFRYLNTSAYLPLPNQTARITEYMR